MSHIDDVVLNAYLDGECGDRRKQEVEEHLTDCRECQARLESAETARSRASKLVGALEPGPIHSPAWEEIAGRAAASSSAAAPQLPRTPSRSRRRPLWRNPALAWAATVVIAFGLGWLASSPWITPAGEVGQVAVHAGEDASAARVPASEESADAYEEPASRSEIAERLSFADAQPDDSAAGEDGSAAGERVRGVVSDERTKNEEVDRLVAAAKLGEVQPGAGEQEEGRPRDRSELAAVPGPPAEPAVDADRVALAKKEKQADAPDTEALEPEPEALKTVGEAAAVAPDPQQQEPEQREAQEAGAAGRQDVGEREAARARRLQAADEVQVAAPVSVVEQVQAAEQAQVAEQVQVGGAMANYRYLLERNAGLRSNAPVDAAPGWVPVQPHEAEAWLGAPLRRLPELALVRVEVGPGVAIEDGFVGRAAVSLLYEDAAGQQITLIQQYGGMPESGVEGFEAGAGAPTARRKPASKSSGEATEARADLDARDALEGAHSLIVTPSGVRAYRWQDSDGYLLILASKLSSDALRALADRVR